MTTFVNNNVQSGKVIYASDHNEQGARVAAVLNGGIDDSNVSSISGTKLVAKSVGLSRVDGGTTAGVLATDAAGSVAAVSQLAGRATTSTSFSTASTTDVALGGLSTTFTVPTGGATYKLEFYCPSFYNSTTAYTTLRVWDGAIGGTKIIEATTYGTNGTALPLSLFSTIDLTAGSHTLNVSMSVSSGTGNALSDSGPRQTTLLVTRVF